MRVSTALNMLHEASVTRSYDESAERSALGLVLHQFMRETRCVLTSRTVPILADATSFDVSTWPDFRMERVVRAELVDEWQPVLLKSYATIAKQHRERTTTGAPQWFGWRTHDTGVLWPRADAGYTLRLTYAAPAIDVVITQSSSEDPEINIPEEYLFDVIRFGATAVLEHNDPDALFQSAAWQKFEKHIEKVRTKLAPMHQGEVVFDPREYA
jgi:hypothetical protein